MPSRSFVNSKKQLEPRPVTRIRVAPAIGGLLVSGQF
jgi:hypothetical protein